MPPSHLTFYLFLLFGAIFLSFFFSLTEAVFMSASEERLHKLESDGYKPAKLGIELLSKREKIVSVAILLNNIINVFATSVLTLIFVKIFHDNKIKLGLTTFCVSIFFFLFCESIPKTIGVKKANAIILSICWVNKILLNVFRPLIYFLEKINNFLDKKLSPDANQSDEANNSILGAIEMYYRKGAIKEDYKEMLSNVLNLEKYDISTVMTQRGDIYSISIDDSFEKIKEKILTSKYSKIPVFNENHTNVLGVINIVDFIKNHVDIEKTKNENGVCDLKSIMMQPYFIPEGASLKSQLPKFKAHGSKIGFIVDEYGSIIGMVTIEDIVEHIVGDISDVNDNSDYLIDLGKNEFLTKGETSIKEINEKIGSKFDEDGQFLTIAGLIMDKMETIPRQQESIDIDNFRFLILEVKDNRIFKIKIKKLEY